MKLTSNMKKSLGEDLMRLCAAVCDSRKYDSNQDKMVAIAKLLKMHEIDFTILGGATNRLAVNIDGYGYKIALDSQGYRDNFIEYSLSSELQPFVTKTYETNGYILVAEYVNQMNLEVWRERKEDIIKILSMLGQDYLLGDVGYTSKNYMNWGTRDDGSVVILDYAYCHRATETLFKCDKCGEGLLTYDVNYTMLMCTNRANGCNAKYSYNDRKVIQGDQVDLDMIEEMKTQHSVVLEKGVYEKEVELASDFGEVFADDVVVVHSEGEYNRYLREEDSRVVYREDYDQEEALDLLIDIARAKDNGDVDQEQTLVAVLNDRTFQEKRPKRRVVFAEDYTLQHAEPSADEYHGPDPVVYYDDEYGYPLNYEALGFENAKELKDEFYAERAKMEKKGDVDMFYSNEEESTVDDLIEILKSKEQTRPAWYNMPDFDIYDDTTDFTMDDDDADDETPQEDSTNPSEDSTEEEETAEVLVNGVPVEG